MSDAELLALARTIFERRLTGDACEEYQTETGKRFRFMATADLYALIQKMEAKGRSGGNFLKVLPLE
jgi:hypothetical protein